MDESAQALGAVVVEPINKEQAAGLLGRWAAARRSGKPPNSKNLTVPDAGGSTSRALVALSAGSDNDYGGEDLASSVLKPGLLRRILKPDFADVYDRLDIRISALEGEGGDQAAAHLIAELGQRRGLKAKSMNAKVELAFEGNPVAAMRELKRAADRWLVDNGGDVLVWGALANAGSLMSCAVFRA